MWNRCLPLFSFNKRKLDFSNNCDNQATQQVRYKQTQYRPGYADELAQSSVDMLVKQSQTTIPDDTKPLPNEMIQIWNLENDL